MFLLVVVMQSLFSFVHKKTHTCIYTVTGAYTCAQKHAEVYFSCCKYSVIDVMGHIAI